MDGEGEGGCVLRGSLLELIIGNTVGKLVFDPCARQMKEPHMDAASCRVHDLETYCIIPSLDYFTLL